MKNDRVKKITGIAILLAIEIILQTVAFLTSGIFLVSFNLALIPIVVAAIVYGPWAGAFLGLFNGVIVLLDPSTELFLGYAPFGTVITCLLKCTIAGLVAGLVFKMIAKKNKTIGAIVASVLVPVINTGLFALACFTIIGSVVDALNDGQRSMEFVFLALIGWNFVFEFGITAALSPTIVKIMKVMTRSDKNAL